MRKLTLVVSLLIAVTSFAGVLDESKRAFDRAPHMILHPSHPLTDADRAGWLSTLRGFIERAMNRREPLILACSALTKGHRDRLAGGLRTVRFVYLKVQPSMLRERLTARGGHFAHANLLESQLAALQEPRASERAITVNGAADVNTIVGTIRLELGV